MTSPFGQRLLRNVLSSQPRIVQKNFSSELFIKTQWPFSSTSRPESFTDLKMDIEPALRGLMHWYGYLTHLCAEHMTQGLRKTPFCLHRPYYYQRTSFSNNEGGRGEGARRTNNNVGHLNSHPIAHDV